MIRIAVLALVTLVLSAGVAPAQVIYVESRPRVISYYAPPPVFVQAPVVTYSSPVVYSAPIVSYSAPVVSHSYYPATTVYSVPVVGHSYYPSTTVYSAPAAIAAPGVVTTRSFVGLGIFRPRGVYTETYVSPR